MATTGFAHVTPTESKRSSSIAINTRLLRSPYAVQKVMKRDVTTNAKSSNVNQNIQNRILFDHYCIGLRRSRVCTAGDLLL
jgi:hypothetical protein